MSEKNTLTEDLVDDAVKYQKVKTSISSVFFVILSIILISIGIYIRFVRKNKPDTLAQITKVVECNEVKVSNSGETKTTYTCVLEIKYTINEKEYTNKLIVENLDRKYYENETVKINYDNENPNNISTYTDMYIVSYILIGLGTIFLICIGINLYLVHKYKTYALIQTAGDVSSAVRSPSSLPSSPSSYLSPYSSILGSKIKFK